MASCPMIFMGLALVHFQKYWLLSNENSPNNTDPITEMELEHAFEPDYNNIKWFFQGPVNRGGKDNSYEIVSELTSNDVEEEVYSSLNDDTPSMKSKRHKIDITERSSKCLPVFSWSIFIRAVIDHMTCYNLNWPKIKLWVHYFIFSCALDHILKS